ncbi:VRR-NUC domain-containing protein [Bathymodiolus japonicus methanotrophic gill symbiont]|uniref:VRR-NUC domain-containing protein n=1 Tax=Bathymodiolus japonicus methanotrophic gill symbiont TaxID=113269 RepID=UPI001C8DF2A0|nr:VRR-NUC domain-containing protein [Bathymodiolus japonicus methanotrophic gill symbiont]
MKYCDAYNSPELKELHLDAINGGVMSSNELAEYYRDTGDEINEFFYVHNSAKLSDFESMRVLGIMYEYGVGCDKDMKQSDLWIKKYNITKNIMKYSEAKIETKICSFAESKGWISFKFTSPGNNGVPDRIFFKDGKTILVEFKSKEGKLSEVQKFQIKKLKKSGIFVKVVSSIEYGMALFNEIEDEFKW